MIVLTYWQLVGWLAACGLTGFIGAIAGIITVALWGCSRDGSKIGGAR